MAANIIQEISTAVAEGSTEAVSVEEVMENIASQPGIMDSLKNFSFGKLKAYGDQLVTGLLDFVGNIVFAVFILVIGFKLSKKLTKTVENFLAKRFDANVVHFLTSATNFSLRALVIFWAVTRIGVTSSSIIALLGSATVTVGLALQGSLSNIAGGVLILMLKPFQIGDYIVEDHSGNEGTVTDIDMFYTRLQTIDNKTVVIPNGIISNCSLTNVTRQDSRRIDLTIGIDYRENIDKVKKVLQDIVDHQDKVIRENSVDIFVGNFAASSIEVGLRFWVPMDDYWQIRWEVLEKIKKGFDAEGITIPYNQLDVRVKREG